MKYNHQRNRALIRIKLLKARKRAYTLIELPVVRKQGYTLIELLIASTIFAMIMVIVVATFSWTAGYNSKLKQTRRVAQSSRLVAKEISDAIRLANGSVKVSEGEEGVSPAYYMSEIGFLSCRGSNIATCGFLHYKDREPVRYKISGYDIISAPIDDVSNAILILQQDQKKIIMYHTQQVGSSYHYTYYRIQKHEATFFKWPDLFAPTSCFITDGNTTYTQSTISDTSVRTKLYFGGYGPRRGANTAVEAQISINSTKFHQPFAEFYLIGQTQDYEYLLPKNRSQFELKTLVTSRHYD